MAIRRVLLVDDNPKFLDIVIRFLETHAQFETIVTAPSGSEALARAREQKPDLVLLDLGMPGLNGLEILPVLRTLVPRSLIVILTLLDTEAYRRAARRAGADAFVSKGALHAELLPTIDRLVQKASASPLDADPASIEGIRHAG